MRQRLEARRGGTFAPFFRASESPMAMACFRLLTVRPLLPLFSVPRFRRRIADATVFCADLPYLREVLRPLLAMSTSRVAGDGAPNVHPYLEEWSRFHAEPFGPAVQARRPFAGSPVPARWVESPSSFRVGIG